MRSMRKLPIALAASLLMAAVTPQLAIAGMGNAASAPVYHAEPCQGDACRADDARSGSPCEGLLCTFSSAKAMQTPMTAAKAAEAQQAAAATEALEPIDAAAPKVKAAKGKAKAVAKTKVSAASAAATQR